MDPKDDPRITQWLEMIEASQATRRMYISFMKVYCDCIKKTPSELIEEAIKETRQGLLLPERKTVEYITKFKQCLAQKGLAPKSLALGITAIKSFYKTFDIQLSSSIGKNKKRPPLRENLNFLTKEDIKKLIQSAKNLRERAIIFCMGTSGMARQEIINLRIQDITFDESGIGVVSIRRQKSQIDYTTFISPEAVASLKAYFEERNRNPKIVIKGPNDFVFVNYTDGGKLNPQNFVQLFNLLGKQLGYENGRGFIKTHSHALRKFFASTLENAGMPKNRIDYMLGHAPSQVDSAYFNIDAEKLKQLYIKYLPYLTFEKTIEVRSLDTEDAKRLEEVKKENKELKREIQAIRKDLDARGEADDTLNKLFADPEFQQMLLRKMKELG